MVVDSKDGQKEVLNIFYVGGEVYPINQYVAIRENSLVSSFFLVSSFSLVSFNYFMIQLNGAKYHVCLPIHEIGALSLFYRAVL